MSEIIKFESISKRFGGIEALKDVSFSIEEGTVSAIVGENGAGKSTLMNVLNGLFLPNSGKILINGKEVHITNPRVARSLGIAMVYQELKLCQNLSITANMFLGHELRKKSGGLDWKEMQKRTKTILGNFGLSLEPSTIIRELSTAQMQLVEIAKAVNSVAKIVILDEPTSSLTENETRKLFDIIRNLKAKGVTVIFITHRLDEVFEITDKIYVMRNGGYIGAYNTSEITPGEVVALIAGRSVNLKIRQNYLDYSKQNEVALEVENYSRGKYFQDVSFKLYKNEILGFYGLQGSGRSEIMETIFGLYKPSKGKLKIDGKEIVLKSAKDAMRNGVGLVTEDRKRYGIMPTMSVEQNIALVHEKRIKTGLLLSARKIRGLADEYISKLSIKLHSPTDKITSLSGGNQQKVVISRQLSMMPSILIMDEPTRGVDVGAKSEIFDLLHQLRRNEGKSIIVISSELSEIIAQCDRILVMHNGHLAGELINDQITKKNILDYAFGEISGEATSKG